MSSNPSLIPVHIFLDRKSRGGDEMQGVEGGNTRASQQHRWHRDSCLPLHLRLWRLQENARVCGCGEGWGRHSIWEGRIPVFVKPNSPHCFSNSFFFAYLKHTSDIYLTLSLAKQDLGKDMYLFLSHLVHICEMHQGSDGEGEDVQMDTLSPSSTNLSWIYFAIINIADDFFYAIFGALIISYQRTNCGPIFQVSEFPKGRAMQELLRTLDVTVFSDKDFLLTKLQPGSSEPFS